MVAFKHGSKPRPLYRSWHNMCQRCNDASNKFYNNYGGRNIVVCPEWLDFINFRIWAFESGWAVGLTIERINNNGNYEPDNCKWTTSKEQNNNKRNNHNITFKGETLTLMQWSEKLNINYQSLANRVNTYNWPIEKAFTTPIARIGKEQLITFRGKTQNIREWSDELNLGIGYDALRYRLKKGMKLEDMV